MSMVPRPPGLSFWSAVVAGGLVVGGTEWMVRRTADQVPLWYAAAGVVASREDVGFLFVGSSRTGAAVATWAFERQVRRAGAARGRALNLGRGYSTTVEHYLGLRDLMAEHPERLRGLTVFVEAPGGNPEPALWEGRWSHPAQPAMLLEVLRWRDMPAYWRRSGEPLEEKIATSTRLAFRDLALVRRRERFRERLLGAGAWIAARAQGRSASWPFEGEPFGFDLSGAALGGTKPAAARVPRVRRLALRMGRRWTQRKAWVRWERTVDADLVRLIRERGGRVWYFAVPRSSAFAAGPERKAEEAAFAAWAAQVGSAVLWPKFDYDDSDLPDLLHLRASRAPDFTRALARAWLEADRAPR
jgi:hypothetical protein